MHFVDHFDYGLAWLEGLAGAVVAFDSQPSLQQHAGIDHWMEMAGQGYPGRHRDAQHGYFGLDIVELGQ
nr:hypothetical protein [Cyanobium sp. BA20m-p-22]